ncbi:protocadherin alpha-4 isoform X14 [Esox lucius]|uniref:protocadherin alpha-4 isoform X14 n=1 Tax=Esox lucius TaxID=8010 RepID=UPI001476E3C7|nr:protocadherin alpha-4 isoform X14 [Esox lucius]
MAVFEIHKWFWIVNIFWMFVCSRFCVSGQITYSISEEVQPGTFVGNLAKDLSLKVTELETRRIQIESGSSIKHFKVNLNNGALIVSEAIDREKLCPNIVVCTESLEVIVNHPLQMFNVEVNILDVNDNAPHFPEKTQIFRISEQTSPGAKFPLPTAEDNDVGSNSIDSYKLSANPFFHLEIHTEADRGPSAELVLQKALDREKQVLTKLILTAVDGGKPPRSGTTEIIVNVLDANDNAPVFSKALYKTKVLETVTIGTTIIRVNATDLDDGLNGDIMYLFSKQGQRGGYDKFAINQSTGEITVAAPLDYEESSAYDLRVEARDLGSTPLASHCKVLVEIVDVNDNAPDIKLSSLLESVREDARKGMVIALITVIDKDGGKNGLVRCSIAGSSPFLLESSNSKFYSLVLGEILDREIKSQFNVTIVARDEGNPPLSSTSVITVHVSDVNDNAPRFPEPIVNVFLKENSPAGSLLCIVTAVDPDLEANGLVTYFLLDPKNKWTASQAQVNVNSATGEIYSTQSFNYEEVKKFQFHVQATDSGVPPLSSNVTVNVFILDENDNSPVILPPYSDPGSVHSENIPYSAEAGYFVTKIRAVDADSGYNALLSYHISEPKGTSLFKIGTSNGELRTKRRMSDNDLKTHPLVILVSDNGEPSLSATVSIDVVVVESTGDMQTTFKQLPVKEESFTDLNLYLLIAIVSVAVIFLLSLIILIVVKCHRTDGSFSRYSAPMITTHPDGSWSYSKSTQQYDVCFSSDTMKSDVVVYPTSYPPADCDLISINGGDTLQGTQTLPNSDKDRSSTRCQKRWTKAPLLEILPRTSI